MKRFHPEEVPKEKCAKDMRLYKSFELLGLHKLHLPLKDYMEEYFWLRLRGHFSAGFFPGVFFSQAK